MENGKRGEGGEGAGKRIKRRPENQAVESGESYTHTWLPCAAANLNKSESTDQSAFFPKLAPLQC